MNWNGPVAISVKSLTPVLNLKEIRRLYWDEKSTILAVADSLGIPQGSIHHIMCLNNIPRRSIAEALALKNERVLTVEERNKTHHFCPKCSEVKRIGEFYRCASHANNIQAYCKKCWQESYS